MRADTARQVAASASRRRLLAAGIDLGLGAATATLLAAPRRAQPAPGPQAKEEPARGRAPGRRRIFITGSTTGLGHAAASTLLAEGHEVVVHARSRDRLPAVGALVARGAVATVGDLSDLAQVRALADQANAIGRMDAVIHNAGVSSGPHVMVVNVTAPYLLTALMTRPRRLVFLSSAMHMGGRAELDGIDWTGGGSYSDSKLFVTALAAAIARRWPEVCSNAVNPGWVPTRMGGAHAPDDLRLGHLTQEWLATSDDPRALTSGGYWHHQERRDPHPAVRDTKFQDALLEALARATGVALA